MKARRSPSDARNLAHPQGVLWEEFAIFGRKPHLDHVGHQALSDALPSGTCYPSPSLRSGPSQAGPIFSQLHLLRQGNAEAVRAVNFRFDFLQIALESSPRTTNKRGSGPCASRLFFSPFLSFLWQVACKTPRRAGLPARSLVQPLPMRWMKIWWRALPLAGLPVPHPAASRSRRPASQDTDDLTAQRRHHRQMKAIRAKRPDGLFRFARNCHVWEGTRCSRRY
jgi:hypothetical protein